MGSDTFTFLRYFIFTQDIVRNKQDVFHYAKSKSRIVTQVEKIFWLTPAMLLTGCTLSPAIPVIGAYYLVGYFALLWAYF